MNSKADKNSFDITELCEALDVETHGILSLLAQHCKVNQSHGTEPGDFKPTSKQIVVN